MTSTRAHDLDPRAGVSEITLEDPYAPSWLRVDRLLALAGVLVIALRIELPKMLTVGDVLAIGLAPVWLPVVRRYASARSLMVVGLLAVPFGALLTIEASADHVTSVGAFVNAAAWMVGLVASLGFLLWAREQVGVAAVAVVFGIGLLLSVDPTTNLFPSNPWKFGFAVPVTVLALALAHWSGRRRLELVLAALFTGVCLLTDARSSFGILLLTTTLMAWQLRPTTPGRKGSAMRAFLGFATVLVSVYYLGQALLLGGAFGATTQARTAAQLDQSGFLLVGGRPELLGALALIRDDPLGPGAGTLPNFHEVVVAKEGMAQIGYDPENGYVENWMFGDGYALHSMFGDLWAQWGLAGLVFTGLVLFVTLRRLAQAVSAGTASAVVLFLSCLTLWNVVFAPWYSGLRLLELLLALTLLRRPDADLVTHDLADRHLAAPRS